MASQGVRVWNLIEKGVIFEKMVQPEVAMKVVDKVIGDDFCLGSFAANYLQPGAGSQKPHLDYPYWDYVNGRGSGSGAWPGEDVLEATRFGREELVFVYGGIKGESFVGCLQTIYACSHSCQPRG